MATTNWCTEMRAAIRPFGFDEDFSVASTGFAAQARTASAVAEAADRVLAEQDAMMAVARADGFEAGLVQARNERDARVADTLGHMVRTLQQGFAATDTAHADIMRAAADMALAAAEVLAGRAIAADPLAPLRAALPELFAAHGDAPVITVRVAPALVDDCRSLTEDMADAAAFSGRLRLEADAALAPGDAVVEWRKGGWRAVAAERRAAITAAVEDMLAAQCRVGE